MGAETWRQPGTFSTETVLVLPRPERNGCISPEVPALAALRFAGPAAGGRGWVAAQVTLVALSVRLMRGGRPCSATGDRLSWATVTQRRKQALLAGSKTPSGRLPETRA